MSERGESHCDKRRWVRRELCLTEVKAMERRGVMKEAVPVTVKAMGMRGEK